MTMKKRLLDVLYSIGKDVPTIWQDIEELWRQNEEGQFFKDSNQQWPSWCFVPDIETYDIAKKYKPELDNQDRVLAVYAAVVSAFAAWRYSQSIYKFHPALKAELLVSPPAGEIPIDVLLQMPEWAVFIDCEGDSFAGLPLLGFFAELQVNWASGVGMEQQEPLLNILLFYTSGDFQKFPIPLRVGQTFDDALDSVLNRSAISQQDKIQALEIKPFLSLLLYVCSDGVEYRGKDRPSMPSGKQTRRQGLRLFPASKVRTWMLGEKVGAQLVRDKSNHALWSGKIKPHIRRAHWHTYYAGKRDKEREVRVKWLPPTPVGMPPEDL